MKKLFIISVLAILASCGDSSNNKTDNTDSTGATGSSVTDTVTHPSGVVNSSVISTDTAAINVQNTLKKADSIKKSK